VARFQRIALVDCTSKLTPGAQGRLAALSAAPLVVHDGAPTEAELIRLIADVDCVVAGLAVDFTSRVFDAAPGLRYLGVCGSALRRVDLDAAAARGVKVTNVVAYCDRETAEFCIAALLQLVRGLAGPLWRAEPASVIGKTLGVLGLGAVGREVARLGHALGMRVLYFSPTRRSALEGDHLHYVSRAALLRESDFLSLHTPNHQVALTAADFDALTPGAVLVNTSVGPVLDGHGLASWLARGRGFALFDSVAGAYSPIREHERVVIAERPAYRTSETLAELSRTLVAQLEQFLSAR
jgi:phosphoglycerate dehydrogenase-like enzyme